MLLFRPTISKRIPRTRCVAIGACAILASWIAGDARGNDDLIPRELPPVDSVKVWDNTTLEDTWEKPRPPVYQSPVKSAPPSSSVELRWKQPSEPTDFNSLLPSTAGTTQPLPAIAPMPLPTVPPPTFPHTAPLPSSPALFVAPPEAASPMAHPEPFVVQEGCVVEVPFQPNDFRGTPVPAQTYQPCLDVQTYFGKAFVPSQRPWVEWWRPFYSGGIYDPAIPLFTDVNPLTPHFLVYGDYRAAVGVHRNNGQPVRSIANRLNLDLDLRLTGTERIHAFMGPLDHNDRFTRLDFSDSSNVRFEEELDAQFETLFFEGDLGAMTGGWIGVDAPFDLPFTFGRVPLLYQNGIWMEDAINGVAIAIPWQHSQALNWSNFDATFFAGFNQITSPAFANDNQAAQVLGTAWFVEAYDGYIEADYAYLDDQDGLGRSYHNMAFSYTRRYWSRVSHSVRALGNLGQSGPRSTRTADGMLLLWESSLITDAPSTVVPYFNAFFGYGRPQSVARAAGAGGILRNTGINFESDNLTGYPTLDASGSNAYGGAVGINFLSTDFRRQLAVEFAALDTYGEDVLSAAPGAQYGLGTRWQKALNNWTLVRLDLMHGWLDNAPDIFGTRAEFRWKF